MRGFQAIRLIVMQISYTLNELPVCRLELLHHKWSDDVSVQRQTSDMHINFT